MSKAKTRINYVSIDKSRQEIIDYCMIGSLIKMPSSKLWWVMLTIHDNDL